MCFSAISMGQSCWKSLAKSWGGGEYRKEGWPYRGVSMEGEDSNPYIYFVED